MTGKMLLLSALLVCAVTMVHSTVDSADSAMEYLKQYGYMKTEDGSTEMDDALCSFQYMANIEVTCELNDKTMEMMNLPRCGMTDVNSNSMDVKRKKRYALGPKWSRTDLTYRIDSRTRDISNSDDVDATMAAALKVWSDVTPLTFRRVTGNTAADIIITFGSGNHGDNGPFDGPSGVLAHAYYPEGGDAHFDEDEQWTINTNTGINLFQVAAHEFGHSLGLDHSTIEEALMAPFYRGYVPNFQLHSDDIAGIQYHYRVNSGRPDATMAPNPGTPDLICSGKLDATTSSQDGNTYLFEGSYVWKRDNTAFRIAEGFPKPIKETFPDLPDDIDAAIYLAATGKTYIFKGTQNWRYVNEVLDAGYPRPISSDWPGLPNDIDAAFTWSRNGRLYFIKGDQYYRFTNEGVGLDLGYPRSFSVWKIPGNQVSSVIQWQGNRRTYFFTPAGQYYRFDDSNFRVASGYPREVSSIWQGV